MKRIILNHQKTKVCYFVQFDNKNIELIKKNYHLFLYIIVFHYICMQVYNLKNTLLMKNPNSLISRFRSELRTSHTATAFNNNPNLL